MGGTSEIVGVDDIITIDCQDFFFAPGPLFFGGPPAYSFADFRWHSALGVGNVVPPLRVRY